MLFHTPIGSRYVNFFATSGDCCHQLIAFANSFDPTKDGPDLDLNCVKKIKEYHKFMKTTKRIQKSLTILHMLARAYIQMGTFWLKCVMIYDYLLHYHSMSLTYMNTVLHQINSLWEYL